MPSSRRTSATEFIPPDATLDEAHDAVQQCRGCELYKFATQAVFGEGNPHAEIMLVGEMPGDQEDQQGSPFVGPAGRLLWESIDAAGLKRKDLYVTNVVKHFKWTRDQRTRRRIHKKPSDSEVRACSPWLMLEVQRVSPRIIVCLGATAAQGLLGKSFRVTRDRGKPIASDYAEAVIATVHPSAILRMPEAEQRREAELQLQQDLGVAVTVLHDHGAHTTSGRR